MPYNAKWANKMRQRGWNRATGVGKKITRNTIQEMRMKAIAKKAAERVVARKIETKVHHHSTDLLPITAVGMVSNLHDTLQQGVGREDVVGVKIEPTSLYINLRFLVGAATVGGDAYNVIQWHIVQDMRPTTDLGDITPTDLWFSPNDSGVVSIFNPDYVPRFIKILQSGTLTLTAADMPSKLVSLVIKEGLHNIVYQGNPEAINSDAQGKLWLCCISDSGILPHPAVQFECLLYYKDG